MDDLKFQNTNSRIYLIYIIYNYIINIFNNNIIIQLF